MEKWYEDTEAQRRARIGGGGSVRQNHSTKVSQSPTAHTHHTSCPSEPSSNENEALHMPPYFRARIQIDDVSVTLVIASDIQYKSLAGMVDAKVVKYTNRSIGNKTARLRYRDEDGDFVTIDGDEAVQLAFLEWLDQRHDLFAGGMVGEIQLYFHPVQS